MTDIMELAGKLYTRVKWQNVPEPVTQEDLTELIADAIRHLYVMTGRALTFDEEWFIKEEPDDGEEEPEKDVYLYFVPDLPLDEKEYVQVSAEIALYREAQTDVNELTSYTTDAMAVSHGDKPFANLQQTIDDAESRREKIWYKMIRYHLL